MTDMKDSGVQWIADIPSNWEVKHLKNVCNMFTGNSIKDEEKDKYTDESNAKPYISSKDISVSNNSIDYQNGMYIKNVDSAFRVAHALNTLMCIEGGSAGRKKALLNQDVCFVNKLCCLNPFDIDGRYLFHYLCNPAFEDEFKQAMQGMIGGVTVTNLRTFKISFPPLSDQKAIANFLDEKCSNIDNAIEKQKAVVEKLKEYRQSVITEAVIKGLDKDVEMKETGLQWIEKISTEAEIIKLRLFSYLKGRIGWQGLNSNDFIDEGPFCITGTDFINGKVNWDTCYHVSEERYQMDEKIQVKNGDLLITKDGTIGKLAIIDNMPDKACLNSHLLIIRPLKNKYINSYLYYVMSSDIFKKYIELASRGSIMDSLSQEMTGEFKFPIYRLEKQQQIVDYLDNKCSKIDEAIARSNGIIEKLEEYKKSLIYEYVTGKKEVPSKYYEVQS